MSHPASIDRRTFVKTLSTAGLAAAAAPLLGAADAPSPAASNAAAAPATRRRADRGPSGGVWRGQGTKSGTKTGQTKMPQFR